MGKSPNTLGEISKKLNGPIQMGTFGDERGTALTTKENVAFGLFPELRATGDAIEAGTVVYGIRNRFLISKAQTNNVSLYATQGQLRVKADLAAGVHAGIFGYLEQSGTVTFSSSGSFKTAGNFAIEGSSGLTIDSGVNVDGIVITSNLDASTTNNGQISGIFIQKGSGKLDFVSGIQFSDCISGEAFLFADDGSIIADTGDKGSTNSGFITVKVGSATRFINLVTGP